MGAFKYMAFAARVAVLARRFEPDWVYASDALSTPAALLAAKATGARIIYHEHDIPAPPADARNRMIMRARQHLIERADVLVVPSEGRRRALGETGARATVVWNAPLPDEVAARLPAEGGQIRLVYAGSVTRDTLPVAMIHALGLLPPNVALRIIGYQTVGAPNYVDELLAVATAIGVADRVEYRGAFPRQELLEAELSACHIGIATMSLTSTNENLRTLPGASNKAFDYMARGLPFLVSDESGWRTMYVEPGYAVACDPANPQSIAQAVEPLLDPARRAEMGERARIRIRDDWNYARQFVPVLTAMRA
jgi:glycosyltransferase involved in cell wall biosynthesis